MAPMNDDPAANCNDRRDTAPLAPWSECEFFCIHDYAGSGTSPCGWRGRREQARHMENGHRLLCPRCGGDTLFRIPEVTTRR